MKIHFDLFWSQVSATDEDRGSFGTITYALTSKSGGTVQTPFTINKQTGQLCTASALDRDEGLEKYDLTVTATDGVSLSLMKEYIVWEMNCSN